MTLLQGRYRASAQFSCAPELLFELLIDYDSYKDWMPLVRDSRLLAKEGEIAIVRLHPSIPGSRHIDLECIQTLNQSVLSRVIEGEAAITGLGWDLEELAASRCRVTVTVHRRRWPFSRRRRFLQPRTLLDSLWSYAAAFLPEIEWPGESVEKVLEIFEGERGLTCWLNGRLYDMRPAGDPK